MRITMAQKWIFNKLGQIIEIGCHILPFLMRFTSVNKLRKKIKIKNEDEEKKTSHTIPTNYNVPKRRR